jgi:predicted dehydrogenase
MLKIGVLGAGHLGKIHIQLILELNTIFELVGFYDPNDQNAQETEQQFGITRYDSLQNLLAQVDCIDIVTPTRSHFEGAVAAIKRSKHVFIEKPIAESTQEAISLVKLAHEAGVKVQVGHVERFNPAFQTALPHIEKPMFIEAHRLAIFNTRGTDVSVVLDLMIHDLDIVLSTVKSEVKRISASGVAVVSDSHDIANVRVEFDNGCVANLTASRISLKNQRKMRFFQKNNYISVDFLNKQTDILKLSEVTDVEVESDVIINLGTEKKAKKIAFERPTIENINAMKEELIAFHHCILTNSSPVVSIEDGLKALIVANQIIEKLSQTQISITNNNA